MKTLSPPAQSAHHGGQTLALMAFVMPVLIGAMGLAADVANFYFNYVRVQTAADASVLSGVKYLPDQPAAAISTANNYATSFNGIVATDIVSTTTSYDATLCASPGTPPPPPVPGCKLTMTVQRTVAYYFARLIGVNSGTLSVTATRHSRGAGGVGQLRRGSDWRPGWHSVSIQRWSCGSTPICAQSQATGCGRHLEQPCACGSLAFTREHSGGISEPRFQSTNPWRQTDPSSREPRAPRLPSKSTPARR